MFSFGIRVLSHDASISRVGGGKTQAWTKPAISTDNRSFDQQAGRPRLDNAKNQVWQPDVTVACVVVRDGRLLVVEEDVQGRRVLNQPAGHLEPDESLAAAALRETLEETGWQVRLTAFIGAYQWQAPVQSNGSAGRHYLRMAFAADPVRHDAGRVLDDGIVQALWLTPEQLADQAARHRSPLVWRVVEDFLAGRRYPLDTLQQIA